MKKLANKKIIIGCGCCIIALLGIFYFLSYKQKDKAVACSLKEEYRKKEPAIDGTPVSELIEPNAVKVYANPYTKNEWKEALVSLEHGYFEDVTMTDDGGYHKKKSLEHTR